MDWKLYDIDKYELESYSLTEVESCSICIAVTSECGQQSILKNILTESGISHMVH